MAVVVFGSINMDLVVRTPRLPGAGETLLGRGFFTAPGGKGANQAVASARLGAATRMVGRVGADVFGGALLDSLRADQVLVDDVAVDPERPSGVALIAVDDQAENTIIVVAGANGALSAPDLQRLQTALLDARVLLLQLEVPMDAVLDAAHAARARDVTVVLDPAPAHALPAELYAMADILTPNESEAENLVGFPVHAPADAERAAEVLLGRGVRNVVIKLGGKGAYWASTSGGQFLPAFSVEAVDTVAAGDAFNGGLAAALSQGLPLEAALRWGLGAGALSVTRPGAQPSLPTRAELLAFLGQAR